MKLQIACALVLAAGVLSCSSHGSAAPAREPAPLGPERSACAFFTLATMCRPLPAQPAVAPQSAAWLGVQHQPGSPVLFGQPDTGGANADPVVLDEAAKTTPHVLVADRFPWSASSTGKRNGSTIGVPSGAVPEGDNDGHLSWRTPLGEYDAWAAEKPDATPGSRWHVGGFGFCPVGGTGAGCSGSTATNLATSLGLLDPRAIAAVMASRHGVLHTALAATVLCASPEWVAPATFSDGKNTTDEIPCRGAVTLPPEGIRFFLDRTDEQIDATDAPAWFKVVLRTMDREHYGGQVVDTGWGGGSGVNVQAMREGWSAATQEPIPRDVLELARFVKFCSNGTC